MHIDLTNAPTNLMWLVNDIFQPHLGHFVIIYFDGIIIFSKYWDYMMQEHRLQSQNTSVEAKERHLSNDKISNQKLTQN